ncbi:MAG: hypothetical protein IPH04_13285 [Saprospirales bacterium]|nr:hypothetical protein [Saprospirales bacterium]
MVAYAAQLAKVKNISRPNTPHYLSLIEKDQLDEVLNLLKENEAEPVATRASALKARIKELNGHINSGFISLADAGIERNKIRSAVMDLVLNAETIDLKANPDEQGRMTTQNILAKVTMLPATRSCSAPQDFLSACCYPLSPSWVCSA